MALDHGVLEMILLTLLAALQLGDWLTTRAILAYPTGYEKNPVIKWLMDRVGIDAALAIKTAFVLGLGYALTFTPWYLLAVLCAYYAWIVWGNWTVLRGLRRG